MNFDQNISWGVLLIVIAAVFILIGISGLSVLMLFPLILLGVGILIAVTGTAYYMRAWGTVIAAAGGLWLSQWFYELPFLVIAGIFLVVVGLLVVLGSGK